ncbi:MAG TPA: oligosaccharide flippase family protein [bacterium]|jgi:O-antigen/teichoic acid export membrane protein
MFASIRRLLRHSAVYGLGHVLSRVVSFLLLPYLTHALTPDQYGAVTLLYTFISIVLVFYIYGSDIAFLRFYILEKDSQKQKQIFGTIFWATTVTSGLFSILIVLASNWLSGVVFDDPRAIGLQTGYLIILCTGILISDTLGMFPYLYLRALEKSLPFILLKVLGVGFHVGLTALFLSVFHRGIAGVFEANLIASALQFVLLLPVILKYTSFHIHWSRLLEFLRFGLPSLPSQLFVIIVELSDRKILELFMGLTVVGIYSAGYKLGLFMAVVTLGFRFAWHPFFLNIADRPDAKETFARVFTYYLLVTASLFLLLVFTLEPLMKMRLPIVGVLIEERYWDGLKVFPIILLAHICNGASANFMVGVYLKKKMGLMPIVTGAAAAVNLGVNLIFIPIFGMMAAPWATCLSFFTLAALLYVLIQPHYRIDYEWRRVGILIVCTAAVYFISIMSFWQDYWMLKLLLLPLFLALLRLAHFFLPDELAAIRRRLFPSQAN